MVLHHTEEMAITDLFAFGDDTRVVNFAITCSYWIYMLFFC